MSLLAAIRTSSRHLLRTGQTLPPASSAFHTTVAQQGLKETDKNRDGLPEFYEAQKDEQLKNSKEGKAKWKHELASNSEAEVKADRGELDSEDKNFQQMQQAVKKGKGSAAKKA